MKGHALRLSFFQLVVQLRRQFQVGEITSLLGVLIPKFNKCKFELSVVTSKITNAMNIINNAVILFEYN